MKNALITHKSQCVCNMGKCVIEEELRMCRLILPLSGHADITLLNMPE